MVHASTYLAKVITSVTLNLKQHKCESIKCLVRKAKLDMSVKLKIMQKCV